MPVDKKYIKLRNDMFVKYKLYAMALSGHKIEIVKIISKFCNTLDRMERRG